MSLITVEEVCKATGDDPREVIDFFLDTEKARLVASKSALRAAENAPPMEALPLADKDGYEFGRVVASIPEDDFFHLMNRSDLDRNWTETPDGVREVVGDWLKSNPSCRVKTVSGKTMVGWTPGQYERTARRAVPTTVNLSRANFNGLAPASK